MGTIVRLTDKKTKLSVELTEVLNCCRSKPEAVSNSGSNFVTRLIGFHSINGLLIAPTPNISAP